MFLPPSWIPVASVYLTMPPRSLLLAIWVRLCRCWLKGGFLCHPRGRSEGIRGGRRRIINTSASCCHRNGWLLGWLYYWIEMLSPAAVTLLCLISKLWPNSQDCRNKLLVSPFNRRLIRLSSSLEYVPLSVQQVLTLGKVLTQEIRIHTALVALPQIPSLIDWMVCKWLLPGLLGLLRSMFST